MALKKALYYGAIGIGILIAVSVAIAVVNWTITLLTAAIQLAVLLGSVYAFYKIASWILGSSGSETHRIGPNSHPSNSSSTSTDSRDRQDRLRQQYVEGQLSEEEFEQRIARELENEDLDRIEAQLERER